MEIEIYTNVELNLAELTFESEILETLKNEGWEEYTRDEHYRLGQVQAINYRFKRIITV